VKKRHHYVPILHLKHFAGQQPAGQVWTYDAIEGTQRSSTPENTAVEGHFYSFEREDGTLDASIEDIYEKFESAAAPAYEELSKGRFPDDRGRSHFSEFLGTMFVRTPTWRRMAGELYSRHVQIMTYAYAVDDDAFDKLTAEVEASAGKTFSAEEKAAVRELMIDPSKVKMTIAKHVTLNGFELADKLANIFHAMKWSIVESAKGYFVSSDNPVVRTVDPATQHPIYGDGGFMNKTARVTFPLSPKRMLLLSWDGPNNVLRSSRREQTLGFNIERAKQSERYLYAHINDKRISALAHAFRHIRPGTETQGFGPKKFARTEIPRKWNS